MKKFILVFLSLIATLCCALTVAACNQGSGSNQEGNNNQGSGSNQEGDDNQGDNADITEPLPDNSHTHELLLIAASSAGCETEGNIEYYTCTCGKWFSDSNANNEIIDKSGVILKATGHSYSDKWTSDETQHWHKATCGHSNLKTTPENHIFENHVCKICGYNSELLLFKTLDAEDDTVYGKVSNATTDFSFIKEVEANDEVTYTVCMDKACNEVIPSKTVDLQIGDNVYYVLATRGNDLKLYTVTIRRRPIYTVNFNTNGGKDIDELYIEEDADLTAVVTPERTGYTFNNWQIDGLELKLPYTVTGAITLNANYSVNNYTVTYELGAGDELEILSSTVTFDEKCALPIPDNKSYIFLGWYYGETQITDGNGDLLAEWTIAKDVTLTSKQESIFTFSNGVITGLTEAGEKFNEIVIPSEIDGEGITSIGESAFSGCANLQAVTIADSIKEIKDFAFHECIGLTSITIPDGVTIINDYTFRRCSSLTSVTIPDSVTEIGYNAFDSCSGLLNITIPNSVTYIGNYAFGSCRGLTSLTIPGNFKSGGSSAFSGCSSLKSLIIDDGVTEIGQNMFSSCSSLIDITIPSSVTSLGFSAFSSCSGLTSITIPDSVTFIPAYTFSDCSSLRNVTAPGVDGVGQNAFDGCSALVSIKSQGLDYIEYRAFSDCCELTDITIADTITSVGSEAFVRCSKLKGNLYDNAIYLGNDKNPYIILMKASSTLISSCRINESTRVILHDAFSSCSNLTSLIIPNYIRPIQIGEYAFYNCKKLKTVYCGSFILDIGRGNSCYTDANKIYYSKDYPYDKNVSTTLQYWHYDADGVTPVIWIKED